MTPTLAADLAATVPVWARAVGRVAEDVADLLTEPELPPGPTPITGRRRAAARPLGPRPHREARVRTPRGNGCITCGKATSSGRRTCSNACASVRRADNETAFVAAGVRTLAALRQVGFQPELTPAARRRIGSRASESLAAAREWQQSNPWPADLATFEREILPGLAGIPASTLAGATGLSVGYCRRVKAGLASPHPMWWETLRQVSGK